MALPPSARQRNHKLRSMCRSQRMRLSRERQVLNRAGRHAFPPSRPAEPAGFSAPGCLVYFYKRCLSSESRSSCNFGSSIRLSVCLLLSWGGKRLWLLTTSTDRGWAARTASPLADAATLVQHNITSDVAREEELLVEGCTFRKYEFKSGKIKLSTWHLDLLCLQTEVWSQAEYPTLITKVITTGHYRKGNITFWYTHCWLENLCQHVKISCSYCCKLEAGLAQKDCALFPVCVSNQSILTQLFPFCHHFVVVACKYLFSAKTDFKNFSRYGIWNQ